MFPYDAALCAAVQPIPQSIPDVVQTLQTIGSVCDDADGLKWFNWLYLQVTEAVRDRIASGGFNDPAWLGQLDVQFACLYFSALKSSLSSQTTCNCWQVLFAGRNQTTAARILFALAGINAHINHDLPKAIVTTCQITGTTPHRGSPHYNDYVAINSTLDVLIDSAKKTLRIGLLGEALPPLSHVEDTIASWNVGASRDLAWQNAEGLWPLRQSPTLESGFMDALDGLATPIGKLLLTA